MFLSRWCGANTARDTVRNTARHGIRTRGKKISVRSGGRRMDLIKRIDALEAVELSDFVMDKDFCNGERLLFERSLIKRIKDIPSEYPRPHDLLSRRDVYTTLSAYYHHKTDIQHQGLSEALSRVPITEPQRWIPVKERHPEENTECLVTARLSPKSAFVIIAYYAHDLYKINKGDFHDKKGKAGWYVFDDYDETLKEIGEVTAWMPIPGVYMGEIL